MAVHDFIKQVFYDNNEDDDAPLVFRRKNTASKQSQLSSASKKASPQKHEGSFGSPVSGQSALNGETSNLQKNTSAVNSGSGFFKPDQSNCIKQVFYDNNEDDDATLVFRRKNTASKQSQLSSASKKASPQKHEGSPQKHEGSFGSPVSGQSALNGETSNSQKNMSAVNSGYEVLKPDQSKHSSQHRMTSNDMEMTHLSKSSGDAENSDDDKPLSFRRNPGVLKPDQSKHYSQHRMTSNDMEMRHLSTGDAENSDDDKPLSFRRNPGVLKPDQSKHSSQHRMTSNDMEMTHLSKSSVDVENSDDDKPLSFRCNPASMAVQKSNFVPAQKALKQSPENKLDSIDTNRMILEKSSRKTKNSDDSDDDKTLCSKFSMVPVSVQKSSLHATQVHESSIPASSQSHKEKADTKKYYDDSEDEKPLLSRFQKKPVIGASTKKLSDSDMVKPSNATKVLESPKPAPSPSQKTKAKIKKDPDDSDDDKPLFSKFQTKPGVGASTKNLSDSDEEKPLSSRLKQSGSIKRDSSSELKSSKQLNKRPLGDGNNSTESSMKKAKVSYASVPIKVKNESVVKKERKTDDSDYIPIAQRRKKSVSSDKQSATKKVIKKVISSSIKKDHKKTKKVIKNKFSKSLKVPPGSGGGQKWMTLQHNGVIFPPPYNPHGIKMLYNGQPVDLTPEQEEVATMFAVMKDTDYATKPKFIENFMNDWRQILGRNHVIKKFELCDFTPIYEWHLREKEKKKQMSTEEKKALKEEKMKLEEKYMWALVDGVKEKVGNFRVEPPGLFRGRGEHPKMGKLKRRIQPKDITINIGKDAPIPECPIPGERWKEIKHDNTVTWLAFWNDPTNPKEFKYVFLAASSALKGQSDKEKYEKARLLKDYIHGIRANYTKDFTSKDATKRQIAVATYLIDKLALRAGNEKDDDEADTVGCCTLKVENVVLVPPNKLQFDFLGKDSIRYFNTVEVELPVYKAIGEFRTARKHNGEKKGDGDDLFDMLDTSKLNVHLKELMPGLTAKVFRTYNASITLDEMLNKETKEGTVPEKIAIYQTANKEVAIICNHQRSVSKSHDAQMSRLNEKIDELKAQREELKEDLSRARKGKPPLKDAEGKAKKNLSPEALQKKLVQVDAKIEKMELDKTIKEDLKTVALGTSKINYLDPRISVAWCKRHEVPIEKIFNKSLVAKFAWAMDVEPSFRF